MIVHYYNIKIIIILIGILCFLWRESMIKEVIVVETPVQVGATAYDKGTYVLLSTMNVRTGPRTSDHFPRTNECRRCRI